MSCNKPIEYTHYRATEDQRPGIQLLMSDKAQDRAVGEQLLKNLVTIKAPWNIVCDDFPSPPGAVPTTVLDAFIESDDCPLWAKPYLISISAKWKTQFTPDKPEVESDVEPGHE